MSNHQDTARTHQPLRTLRVALQTRRDPAATRDAATRIQAQLSRQGHRVVTILPLRLLFNAMGEHVVVLAEGLFMAALSPPLALLLALPLSAAVGHVVGKLALQIPLPLSLSGAAVAGWSAGVLVIAAVASVLPARAATRRTVSDTLNHV